MAATVTGSTWAARASHSTMGCSSSWPAAAHKRGALRRDHGCTRIIDVARSADGAAATRCASLIKNLAAGATACSTGSKGSWIYTSECCTGASAAAAAHPGVWPGASHSHPNGSSSDVMAGFEGAAGASAQKWPQGRQHYHRFGHRRIRVQVLTYPRRGDVVDQQICCRSILIRAPRDGANNYRRFRRHIGQPTGGGASAALALAPNCADSGRGRQAHTQRQY